MVFDTSIRICKGCGCEISIHAYVIDDVVYCCEDCFNNIPCGCNERYELDDDRPGNRPVVNVPS